MSKQQQRKLAAQTARTPAEWSPSASADPTPAEPPKRRGPKPGHLGNKVPFVTRLDPAAILAIEIKADLTGLPLAQATERALMAWRPEPQDYQPRQTSTPQQP